MPETNQAPEDPAAPGPPVPRWRAALPYIATALGAIFCSLLIQLMIRPPVIPALPPLPTPAPPTVTLTVALSPSSVPRETSVAVAPDPSPLPADEGVLRLEILDLEATDRRLWSSLYLLRATSQLDDAVVALQSNNLDEVDRTLLTARRSLDRAYAFSAEQEKGPIDTFRLQISQARDDLWVRPDGLDRRLRQIRQLILSLVDEDSP